MPKLIYGCEVRSLSDNEFYEYEKVHRKFAKLIQKLPPQTPDPVCLANIGWFKIMSYVNQARLLFLWRCLNLPANSVIRQIFVLRFYQVIMFNNVSHKGPVAQIIGACLKYGILGQVSNCILSGVLPSKLEWKRKVKSLVQDHEFQDWRLELKLYRNLDTYRNVVLKLIFVYGGFLRKSTST